MKNWLIGGENISLIIDSGSRFNLISQDDWLVLKTKNAAVFNVHANAHNQFRGYASDEILNVICVFEAPIAIKENPEQIA